MKYKDYINSNGWKNIRKKRLQLVDHCQVCNKKNKLHIHHKTYKNFENEKTGELMTLCASCHSLWHHHLPKLAMRHKHMSRLRRCVKLGMMPKMAFIFFKNRVEYKNVYQIIFNKLKSGELEYIYNQP